MKSGLEGRNNKLTRRRADNITQVSMKSGLEGRNNELDDLAYALKIVMSQ